MKTTDVKNDLALAIDTFTMMQIEFADLPQRRCHFVKPDLTND